MLANIMYSVSATSSVPKYYIYMITVLANLIAESDNFSLNKPFSFKEAMLSPYWKDFEKIINTEFQFFIENNTWKYKNAPSSQDVLTDR